MKEIGLKYSYPLKQFKKQAGQSNHFLITILIGLNGVENKDVGLSDDFHTSWNPQNVKASARRSRNFAINATLAWLIDALDSYIIISHCNPTIIQQEKLSNSISRAGRSIGKKVDALRDRYDLSASVESNLTKVAIPWRNRLVHNFANNEVSKEIRESLLDQKEHISSEYSGLDISSLLNRFDKSKTPRFKEITSLVHAVHNFVYKIDRILLTELDLKRYSKEVLHHHLVKKGSLKKSPNSRAGKIWSKTNSATLKSLKQILQNYGFTTELSENDIRLKVDYLKKISEINPKEAIKRFIE